MFNVTLEIGLIKNLYRTICNPRRRELQREPRPLSFRIRELFIHAIPRCDSRNIF